MYYCQTSLCIFQKSCVCKMGDIVSSSSSSSSSSSEEEVVIMKDKGKVYNQEVVIGMTMEDADKFLKTHYVGGRGGRKTYVANNRHKDRRPERIQVELDKNGKITKVQ